MGEAQAKGPQPRTEWTRVSRVRSARVRRRPAAVLPLEERKARLHALVARGTGAADPLRGPRGGPRRGVLRAGHELGVEGIVSKRRDSVYQPGRRSGWLKIKCLREQPFVVGGYTDQEGMVGGLGALLVGHYEDGRLDVRRPRRHGFTQKISQRACSSGCGRWPGRPARSTRRRPGRSPESAHFVEPALVCRVAFAEWTSDDKIRHPVYRGLAEGIAPSGVSMSRRV